MSWFHQVYEMGFSDLQTHTTTQDAHARVLYHTQISLRPACRIQERPLNTLWPWWNPYTKRCQSRKSWRPPAWKGSKQSQNPSRVRLASAFYFTIFQNWLCTIQTKTTEENQRGGGSLQPEKEDVILNAETARQDREARSDWRPVLCINMRKLSGRPTGCTTFSI